MITLDKFLGEDRLMCTPDLPSLRYLSRNVYVFIFDKLTDHLVFEREANDVKIGKDFVVKCDALTLLKYRPWYDIAGNGEHEYFCLEETLDCTYIEETDDSKSEPLRIKGKVYQVSLDTLIQLDWYYQNDYNYTRSDIQVKRTDTGETFTCFAYLNLLDDFTYPDNKADKYQIENDVLLYPFSTEMINEEEVYSYA